MPPDRVRAPQACTACRRQKTRCYHVSPGAACLRCDRLHQSCSLTNEPQRGTIDDNAGVYARLALLERKVAEDHNSSSTNNRLARLERTVSALLKKLGEDGLDVQSPSSRASDPHPSESSLDRDSAAFKTTDPAAAPVIVLRDLATDIGVESQKVEDDEAALAGLVPPEHALPLLTIFLEHYGRWVAFDPSSPPEALLARVSESPLLLCACCLIAVRHTTQDLAARLAPPLFERAKSLLSTALLVVPQSLEFFQAAIVLSMWSTTVGQVPLSIDSWLLSGFALQHCLSSGLFDIVTTTAARTAPYDRDELDRWCIWNHLCLVHLHYCVGTSRKSMLTRSQVDKCRTIIGSDHATNYELRMVAEVFLYWTIYENTSSPPANALGALKNWQQEWKFVLEQPRSQFLEMGFHFAHLLLYDQSLKSRSARPQESLISDMVHHASAIIHLAIDTADDRTRHLSDHIYHMITFAAVTLCRLLHLYENKLAGFVPDVSSLDSLILDLVSWLRSIGLPCHAAYTLGSVVSAFHKRLRPHAQPASPPLSDQSSTWLDGFLLAGNNNFPEFFGMMETAPAGGGGNWDLLPSWGPFYQGPPS